MKNFGSILAFIALTAGVVSARAVPNEDSIHVRAPYPYTSVQLDSREPHHKGKKAKVTAREPKKSKDDESNDDNNNDDDNNDDDDNADENNSGATANATAPDAALSTGAAGKAGKKASGKKADGAAVADPVAG